MVLEIGAGGGRWTQFLVGAREVVVAELDPQFFRYLKKRFKEDKAKLRFYQTSGYELKGIDGESIDFVFSSARSCTSTPRASTSTWVRSTGC